MNKGKLRSLMFHAGFCNEDGGWDNRPVWEQEHDNFQRFAELIVQETIKQMAIQMDKFGDDQSNNPAWYKSEEAVKKHFGVEE